jgi:LacI family transcriptional regulator
LADGVILSRTEPDDIRVRFLAERGFPFVTHGRTELATAHPYVDFDNHQFAKHSAAALIAAGSRHPFILLPDRRFTFSGHLLHGFMAATGEAGLKGHCLPDVTLDSTGDQIADAVRRALNSVIPPDGLVLPGEISGLAALAAIHDVGLLPGEHVHLAVKQTSGVFDLVRPRVTCLFEDLVEAGELMAGFLLRYIADENPEHLHHVQSAYGRVSTAQIEKSD